MLKRLVLVASLLAGVLSTYAPCSAAQQFYDKTDVERSNSGTIAGNGQCVSVTPLGNSGVSVEVTGGATATLAVTEYLDAAQTAITVPVVAESAPTTSVTSFSALTNMIYMGVVSAQTNVSVCSTAYTSGTATVTVRTGAPGFLYTLGGGGGGGTAPPAYASCIGTAAANITCSQNGTTLCTSSTVSFCALKASQCTFYGVWNQANAAQTVGFAVYDNASTNSGVVFFNSNSTNPLQAAQVVSYNAPSGVLGSTGGGCVASIFGSGSVTTGISVMFK